MEELVDRRILLYTSVPVLLVQMYNPAATELHVLFPTGGLLVMFANNFVFFQNKKKKLILGYKT